LRGRAGAPTVLRGFLFWYGAGIASVLDPARRGLAELAITAARSLAADVDPVAGVLPPGAEDAGLYGWPRPGAIIEAMPGTVPLLAFAAAATDEDRLRSIALARARAGRVLRARRRLGGAVGHLRPAGPAGRAGLHRGLRPRQHLGSRAGLLAGGEFTATATRVADWYLNHAPADNVCFWDFDDLAIPDAPRDTSATAAASLPKLAAPATPSTARPPSASSMPWPSATWPGTAASATAATISTRTWPPPASSSGATTSCSKRSSP
jgi:unsaturated chondroitin disaccharide hydrolase